MGLKVTASRDGSKYAPPSVFDLLCANDAKELEVPRPIDPSEYRARLARR